MDNIKGNFNKNGNTDLWYLLQASFMLKNHIHTIKRLLHAIKKKKLCASLARVLFLCSLEVTSMTVRNFPCT